MTNLVQDGKEIERQRFFCGASVEIVGDSLDDLVLPSQQRLFEFAQRVNAVTIRQIGFACCYTQRIEAAAQIARKNGRLRCASSSHKSRSRVDCNRSHAF